MLEPRPHGRMAGILITIYFEYQFKAWYINPLYIQVITLKLLPGSGVVVGSAGIVPNEVGDPDPVAVPLYLARNFYGWGEWKWGIYVYIKKWGVSSRSGGRTLVPSAIRALVAGSFLLSWLQPICINMH